MKRYDTPRLLADVLRRLGALVLLAGLGLSAHAQSSVHVWPGATAISNGWVFSYDNGTYRPDTGRTYGPGASNAVVVRDTIRLPQPGLGFTAQTARTVPWGNIAKGAAGVAARSLPWIAAGMAVCELLDSAGVNCPPGAEGPQLDPGTSSVTTSGTGYRLGATGCSSNNVVYSSKPEAASAGVTCATQPVCSPQPSSFCSYNVWANGASGIDNTCNSTSSCTIYGTRTTYILQGSTRISQGYQNSSSVTDDVSTGFIWTGVSTQSTNCPPLANGTIPPAYRDGTCPTETRIEPTPLQLEEAITVRGQQGRVVDVVGELVEHGEPVTAPAPAEVTGPVSVPGATTTTTTSSGTTTTETQYMFDYGPDRVTWGRVETGTLPDGSTTTTTTTGPAAEEGAGLCELYPDIVACAKLGDAPDDDIPKETRNVEFDTVDVGGASGCPAPVEFPDGSQFSYQSFCDNLTTIRPLTILIGFFVAGLIVVNALRA